MVDRSRTGYRLIPFVFPRPHIPSGRTALSRESNKSIHRRYLHTLPAHHSTQSRLVHAYIILALDETREQNSSESTYNNNPQSSATIMSPPVSNSAYGSERNIQSASHGERAENHGSVNEVANDSDSDEGTATLSPGN
jgi:hypothetical protein